MSLNNKSLVIKESLRSVFQEAPRINGATAAVFPPIARWNGEGTAVSTDVRGNAELFDSIVVFAHPNAASVPLTAPPIAQTPRWLINIQTQSEDEIANNLGRYFENSLTAKPDQILYSLTRLNQIDVIQKFVVTEFFSSPTVISYPFDAPTANVNFEGGAYLLRELARYDVFVRNGNLIISKNTRNSRGSSESVVATDVEKFHVDFIFNDRETPLPTAPFVSHPQAPIVCEAGPCPVWTWSDLVGLRVSLSLASKDRFAAGSLIDQAQGFELDSDGRLIYDVQFRISLPNFELGELNVTAEDLENCPPSDPNSRCQEECQSVFTDADPNSVRWVGYGNLNSNYCQCGIQAGKLASPARRFVSPDFSEITTIIPNWTPDMNGDRLAALTACVAHFGPCDSRWKAKDPRAQVVCDCIYQTDRFVTGDLGAFSVTYPPAQEALPPLQCRLWQTCRNRLNSWLSTPANASNIFTEECGCLFLERDADGDPIDTRIAQRDYVRLCNRTTCAGNFSNNNNNIYNVRNPDQLAQRFLLAEATFCECGELVGNFGRAAEFRLPRVPGDPEPIAQNPPPQDGSLAPILTLATFNYDLNGPQTRAAGQNCAQAQCEALGASLGCCITPPAPDGFASANFPGHGSYCRNDCNFGSAARNLVRDDLRRVILGLLQDQPLPAFCSENFNNPVVGGTIGQ